MNDVKTVRHVKYNSDDLSSATFDIAEYSTGDGTVNEEALKGICNYLRVQQRGTAPITCEALSLGGVVDHYHMLFDDKVIDELLNHLEVKKPQVTVTQQKQMIS